MPIDVVLVFALYWVTTLGYLAWVTASNRELDKRLGVTG
jgi:hypothetical protein